MNKIFLFAFFVLTPLLTNAQSIESFANNKELISRELNDADKEQAIAWSLKIDSNAMNFKTRARETLQRAVHSFAKENTFCDLYFPNVLNKQLQDDRIAYTANDRRHFLNYLRASNLIDDIFYKIIKDSSEIVFTINMTSGQYSVMPMNLYTRKNSDIDVHKLYSALKTNPDEKTFCTLNELQRIYGSLDAKNAGDRDRQLKRLNFIALNENAIDLATFNKLEILRDKKALEWPVKMITYFNTLMKAKDTMTKNIEKEATNKFSTTYVSRRQKLTQRDRLYSLYNPTQIILLAQIIERTAKRLDSRRVDLNFQLTDDPAGERDIYVLSPMEKYRVSINMLKKEMAETMRSENFAGLPIEYEDLVSAAFETGYIKSDELDPIIKFEEIWNPKEKKWKTYANFAFSLVGSASFYLPPPWNIVGAIGLVVIQSKLIDKKRPADPEDSWNSVIN